MKLWLIIAFLLLPCSLYGINQNDNFIIDTGHSGPIDSITSHHEDRLLFTGDRNGLVRIIDVNSNKVIHQHQVSYMPVRLIAVSPTEPLFAVIESDSLTAHRLSVWNWELGKRIFSHRTEDNPLFVKFSPQGSYIAYGIPSWDSLVFLDPHTGERLPILNTGFGIVSNLFISGTERTLVAYTSSGTIQYWDLQDQTRRVAPIRTRADLTQTHFTPNGLHMVGTNGQELFLINLTNGQEEGRLLVRGIRNIALDPKTGNIAVYAYYEEQSRLSLWQVTSTGTGSNRRWSLRRSSFDPRPTRERSLGLEVISDHIYTTGTASELFKTHISSQQRELISKNTLLPVDHLGISGDTLLLTSKNELTAIRSSFFAEQTISITQPLSLLLESLDAEDFTISIRPNIFQQNLGVMQGPDNSFYLYTKSGSKGEIYHYRPDSTFQTVLDNFPAPFESLMIYKDDKLLALGRDGTCAIIDPYLNKITFQYTAHGIQTLTATGDNQLIAGRTRTGISSSPLIIINTETGETVSLFDTNILTFNSAYDHLTRTLYTIGFEERRGKTMTVLKAHRGERSERTQTISVFGGEINHSSLIVDPATARLFTFLGHGNIYMYGWDGFTPLEATDHIPKSLYIHNNMLISLNRNSTISIWSTLNGELLMTVYLFDDLNWIIVTNKNDIFSSQEGRKYIYP